MSSLPRRRLGDVAEISSGGGAPQESSAYSSQGTPFIRAARLKELSRSGIDPSMEFLTEDTARRYRLRKFPKGSVVFAKSGMSATKGYVYRLAEDSYLVNHLAAILPRNELDSSFLEHVLRFQSPTRLVRDEGYPSIRLSDIASMEIPLPSLAGQRRIAAILDKADELRVKRGASLAQLDTLPHAIFMDMFGDGDGFVRKRLADLGLIITGRTPPTKLPGMFGGYIPFVTPGDLESSSDRVQRSVTPEGAALSRIARKGSTLVCCIGATIGKTGIALEDSAFNQQINAVEWGSDVDDYYGFFAVQQLRLLIRAKGASTTLPILNKTDFSTLQIPVPPMALQMRFGELAKRVSAQRGLLRDSSRTVDELFMSLQSLAFTGEM